MNFESGFAARAAHWDEKSGLNAVDPNTLDHRALGKTGVLWLALTVTDPTVAREVLENKFGFHPVAIEDALSDQERPGAHIADDHVFVTVPVVTDVNDGPDYAHLGLFVCPNALVSVTTGGSTFVDEWFTRWTTRPVELGETSDMLLHALLDAALDDFFPAIDMIQEDVDTLEETVYRGAVLDVAAPVRIRRRLLEMRRQATPFRDNLNLLLRRDTPVISPGTRTYLQDVYDHSLRVLEGIDLNRDILSSIMDAQLSVQSNRLNEVMRNMTSIATILMVLALVPGFYGQNFPHLPWAEGRNAFWVSIVIMFGLLFGGLFIASKIGWLIINWPWEKRKDS